MSDDFQIPICIALTKEINLAGGQRKLVILNSTLAFAMFMMFENILILPIFFIFHLLIVFGTKKDERFFDIFIRYSKHKKYYTP